MNASCGSCEKTWSSLSWAHCSVCHSTFTGVTYFDDHRVAGTCWGKPRLVSGQSSVSHTALVEQDGVFSTVEGHEARLALTEKMAKARAAKGTPSN